MSMSFVFSTHYSKDTGHKWFLEDAFQNEYRMYTGGKWLPTTDSPWTDIVSFIFIFSAPFQESFKQT